jgi:hypothetical protein
VSTWSLDHFIPPSLKSFFNKYFHVTFQVNVDGNEVKVSCKFSLADKILYPDIDGRRPILQYIKMFGNGDIRLQYLGTKVRFL